jgi:hypothetical protein
VGGVGAALLVGAAVLTPRSPASPYATLPYSNGGITFRYPAEWSARQFTLSSSFASGMAKISSQGFVVPCQRDSCFEPLGGTLTGGGIWATWENRGWPAWDFAKAPGSTLKVGGMNARVDIRAPEDWCSSLAGTQTLTVYVDRGQSNWYQLTACLRAPVGRTEARLLDLLHTVRFGDGSLND